MMRYTVTLRTEDYAQARELAFLSPGLEGACFLLCGQSQTDEEVRFLCREVIPVAPAHYLEREPDFLSIASAAYVPVAKRARNEKLAILFVHSHPGGLRAYSQQDNREEPKLQRFFRERAPDLIHGSLVFTPDDVIGRVWTDGFEDIERVRVIGDRFRFFFNKQLDGPIEPFFDRQVRAFGENIQRLLARLHIGIIGAGGTGSPTFEELLRLGVGRISVFDEDLFDRTNVNRVYGSHSDDHGKPKVDLLKRNADEINLGADIRAVPEHITRKETARNLRDCDIIFGCTDKEAPRAILTRLSLYYLIPVFDMGVAIVSEDEIIKSVIGRVTTLLPGEACLFCRGRISAENIRYEQMPLEERQARINEGYAPELATPAPAVIPFTTSVASAAVMELLHRLTGFMGEERQSTEILMQFDQSKTRTNRTPSGEGCFCADQSLWGKGDTRRFLDMWG